MSTRLVITVRLDGLGITDGPGLAALMTGQVIPDLAQLAAGAEEITELKPGQYGWTSDPDTHAVRTHWAVRENEPARLPAEPEPAAEPEPGSRYIAHFIPEAWQHDQAVQVDPLGPDEWDATAFAAEDTGTSRGLFRLRYLDYQDQRAGLAGEPRLDSAEGMLDYDDVFKADPAAPAWVRSHQGPFTIRVRRETYLPGTFVREGHPGDVNDPERYPED